MSTGCCLIVGLGSIGQRHWRNLRALGVDEFVFVRTGLSTLANSELAAVPTLEAGLARQPLLAIVANPTAYHLETALACVKAGCHVLLEKPVSHNLQGCEELEARAVAGGRVILVGYQFRYHPGLRRLEQLLAEGAIGRPVSVRAHWGEYLPGWHPWEDYRNSYSARQDLGGGVLLTLSHPLDYLGWLLGGVAEVAAVTARSGVLDIPIPDTVELQLRFVSGVVGQVHLDYIQRPTAHSMQIIGQRGVLAWDDADGSVRHYQAEAAAWQCCFPPNGFERNHLFLSEAKHFLNCVAGTEQPICSLGDGIQALRLALAAETAAAERQIVCL